MRRRSVADDRLHEPFDLPGLSPVEACRVLIEHSALTWAELLVLRNAAAGEETLLDVDREQAVSLLARWEGPVRGLRFRPLPHWGSAMVRGGAPLDTAARCELGGGNPFAGESEVLR